MLRPDRSSTTGVRWIIQLVVWLQLLTTILSLHPRVSGLEIVLGNREGLERASSCRHVFARILITNTVRCRSHSREGNDVVPPFSFLIIIMMLRNHIF